jgi:hypothetical protein
LGPPTNLEEKRNGKLCQTKITIGNTKKESMNKTIYIKKNIEKK